MANLNLGSVEAVITVDDEPMQAGLDSGEDRVSAWGERLQTAAAAAGVLIAGALTMALAEAMELDAAQTKMEIMLGDKEFATELGEVAGELYARGFTDSMTAALDATQAVFSSHLLPDEADSAAIEDITVKAQALATVLGIDVAEASQYAGALMANGLARDATHAFDLILAGSKAVPAALREDLLEVADEYATYFDSLGISGERAFAMLAAGASRGAIILDKVGDSLKEFTLLATTVDDTGDAYKALGLDAKQMANDLLSGGDRAQAAFIKIVTSLQGVKDKSEQARLAVAFFGTPLEDLDKAKIPAFLEAMAATDASLGDVTGSVDAAAKALEGTASQQLTAFKNKFKDALVDQVAKAVPALTAVGKWLNDNYRIVLPLVGALTGLAAIYGVVTAATTVWTAAQTALNFAMAMNPIGLIVIAIVGLVGGFLLLWNYCDGFRNAITAMWDGLLAGLNFYWETTKQVWSAVADFFVGWWELFSGAWRRVWEMAKSYVLWVVEAWGSVISFVTGLPGKIRSAAAGMWDGIKDAFRGAINWIIGAWNGLSFTLPSVDIPGLGRIGGGTLSTPNLPYLAVGGDVVRSGLAVIHAGERILPAAQAQRLPTGTGSGAGVARVEGELLVRGDGILSGLREYVALNGGTVQTVLGGAP